MLPVLFGALGLALVGASSEKRTRREEDEPEGMGAVTLWMGGRGPAAGTGAASWMGSRTLDQPYTWDEPSSVVANWNKGTIYGAAESSSGDYDIDRAKKVLRWLSARVNRERPVLGVPDPVLGTMDSKSTFFFRVPIVQPLSPSLQAALQEFQQHLDQSSPGVYKLFVSQPVGGSGALEPHITIRIEPGSSASAFGVDDLDDHDEAFGINILGLNIALSPAERLENLDRKIEKAKEKKEKYEKEAAAEGADVDYLSKKIAKLDQMIDKWEEKKEKVEMRMGAMYGGIFGVRWFQDPSAQAQAEVIVKWVKQLQKIPAAKRALRMQKKGYTQEQILQGLDPYAQSQLQTGLNNLYSSLMPMAGLMTAGRITPVETQEFKLWLSKHYPDVVVELPVEGYGHVSSIMPNLTTAFGGESREDRKARRERRREGYRAFKQGHRDHRDSTPMQLPPVQSKTLSGAFWEGIQSGMKGTLVGEAMARTQDASSSEMDEVSLFGRLDFDDVAEDLDDIQLFSDDSYGYDDYGDDDYGDDDFDLG